MSNIYILESDGYYKVGVSADIPKRIKDLQIGNPHIIECIFSRPVPEAYAVEQELHAGFKEHRIIGEWFKFDTETLEKLKDLIVSRMRVCNISLKDKERVQHWFLSENSQKE